MTFRCISHHVFQNIFPLFVHSYIFHMNTLFVYEKMSRKYSERWGFFFFFFFVLNNSRRNSWNSYLIYNGNWVFYSDAVWRLQSLGEQYVCKIEGIVLKKSIKKQQEFGEIIFFFFTVYNQCQKPRLFNLWWKYLKFFK